MTQRESPQDSEREGGQRPPQSQREVSTEARALAQVLGERLKHWLLRLWRLRGGGFYGLGFVLFFVAAEINSLFGDVLDASGPVDFLTSQLFESLIKFFSETPLNFLWALVWPLQFLSWTGQWGLLALLLLFLAFQRWLKPWLTERFLDDDQNSPVG